MYVYSVHEAKIEEFLESALFGGVVREMDEESCDGKRGLFMHLHAIRKIFLRSEDLRKWMKTNLW